jgi:hypothetical protein
MSSYNPLLPQDRTAWLLAIGQKLRVEYDDIAEPMPRQPATLWQSFCSGDIAFLLPSSLGPSLPTSQLQDRSVHR